MKAELKNRDFARKRISFKPSQNILIHLDITAGAGKPSMNTEVSFKVGKGSNYASMTREELAAENAAMKD